MSKLIYAVYKGDEFIVTGTSKECCETMGITLPSFHTYRSRPQGHVKKHYDIIILDEEQEDLE